MFSLLKNEVNRLSKCKIFFIWLVIIVVISMVTGIIILGLGTDGKIGNIVKQNVLNFNDTGNQWSGWEIAASLFSALFTKAAFLLFEAYLISIIIIDEFRNKTINQLFAYPISKNRILWSKIILVTVISFITQFGAHFIIQFAIKLIAAYEGISLMLSVSFFVNLLFITFGTVIIGLLPFVFGMIRHSTVLTMISALVLASLLSNAAPGTFIKSFVNSLPFLSLASLLSLIIIAIDIYIISNKDVNIN